MTRHAQEEATCQLNIISHSLAQTQRLGVRLGELVRGGELLLLDGQLGTGKTTFTQGLAQGMGITDVVNSPTFTLLKEYAGHDSPEEYPVLENEQKPVTTQQATSQQGRQLNQVKPTLYHFDLYRLDDPEEILELGFEDYFYGSGVCAIEWAEKADVLWPTEYLRIRLKMLNETKRGLLFTAVGSRYCDLLQQFQKKTYVTTRS